MKTLPIRSAVLLSAALFALTLPAHSALRAAQATRAQDEAQVEKLGQVLADGSDEERRQAIRELSKIETEKVSELLLKTLKNNLATRRGNDAEYAGYTSGNVTYWTSSHSQNELLVKALGSRKYEKALPTLRRMLKVNEKWLGFSTEAVAANIYLISGRPVKYTYDGEARTYPQPESKPDVYPFTDSLRRPSDDEEAWEAGSLNRRVKELVLTLGTVGGPEFDHEPYYRALKEEVGLATLVGLVKGGDPLVRPYAVEALGFLPENSVETIPVLTEAVRDKDPRVRFRAVAAFGHLLMSNLKPEEARAAVHALKDALGDAEPEVRLAAAGRLGNYAINRQVSMDEGMKDAVALLVSALEDKVSYVRFGAADALRAVGPLTAEVIPALARMLRSPEPSEREAAARALGGVSSVNNSFGRAGERERRRKEIARALRAAADDTSKDVRSAVAESLGEVSPEERSVIPALVKLTKDPSRGARYSAARSLGEFEVERARIARALARMLTVPDEDSEVIEQALTSLGEMGQEARSAAPQLRKLLQSENPRIREHAGYALEKIERPTPVEEDGKR